jgi:hypothetical protein
MTSKIILNKIIEAIDFCALVFGIWYAKDEKDQQGPGNSDTIGCATMFKRFSSVYGNNFADE